MTESDSPMMPLSLETIDETERQKAEAWEKVFTGFMAAFKKNDEYSKDADDELGELSGQLEVKGRKFDALLTVSPYFTTDQGPELLVVDILIDDEENPHPAQLVGWSSWKNDKPHLLACEGPKVISLEGTRIFDLDIINSASNTVNNATKAMEEDLIIGETIFSLPQDIKNPKFQN